MSSVLYATARNGEIIAEHDGNIVVPWWSYTKTVLAAAALTLVRDGALELDTIVEGERSTLRQLLQHRAGLCDYGELREYHAAVARGDNPWPAAELLQRAAAGRLRYEPGHGWRYSNIGYMMVRRLLERTADAPLDSVLMRRVFRPLEINEARPARSRDDLIGVEMGGAGHYDPGWVYHGLLVGPLSEAALLLDRLLGGTLLPPNLLAEMLHAHPVEEVMLDPPWRSPGYGLGLMTEAPDGPIGHSGGGAGSVIAVYRSRNLPVPLTSAVFAPGDNIGEVEHRAFANVESIVPPRA
jgi:CubicO group peptidase (beta-lactamase class C family)